MAVKLDEIRRVADRVASSLGLEVVDVELTGSAKNRVLCVYLEKDEARRAAQAEAMSERLKLTQGRGEAAPGSDDNQEGKNEEGQGEEGQEQNGAFVVPERFAKGELDLKQLSWLTHEDCAIFSRDFGTLLDVEDLIPDSEYTLEASSPGLDRKLSGKSDFKRFQGNLIKLQTTEPVNNNRHWQGKLTAIEGDTITLDLTAGRQSSKSKKSGISTVGIAISNIDKAQLVPEF